MGGPVQPGPVGRIGYMLAFSGVGLLLFAIAQSQGWTKSKSHWNDAEIWTGVAVSLVLFGAGLLLLALDLKRQHLPLKHLRHVRYHVKPWWRRAGWQRLASLSFLGGIAMLYYFIVSAVGPEGLQAVHYLMPPVGLAMVVAGVTLAAADEP